MMIFDVQSSIEYLRKKNQIQDKQLDNLFLQLEEISLLKTNIIDPPQISYNFLHKLRIEVVDSILIFLDLKSLLAFRLVSNSANKLVLTTIPQKIDLLKHQKQSLESEISDFQKEGIDQNAQLEEQQLYQQAQQQLNEITKGSIVEMKSFANPPQIVQKVMTFVQIILDPTFKPSQDSWKSALKLLSDPMVFIQRILSLNIDTITEKQVQLLQEVNQIEVEQVTAVSFAASKLFGIAKYATMICESKRYQKLKKLKQVHEKIGRLEKVINNLQKLPQ